MILANNICFSLLDYIYNLNGACCSETFLLKSHNLESLGGIARKARIALNKVIDAIP